jgi:hypothetical protein
MKGKLKLTQRDLKLIDQSILIKDNPATIQNASFMLSIFCQLAFPRSDCGEAYFLRECGKARLALDAGMSVEGEKITLARIPYGMVPRLILNYIFSCAVRYKSPEVDFGNSAAEMMRRLGLSPTGGKRGNYANFKNQLAWLADCNIEFDFHVRNKKISYCGKIFSDHDFHLNVIKKWSPKIILENSFYEVLVGQKNAVPIDMRAVSALKGSALALDIYYMLSERLHRVTAKPVTLYWKNLRVQFGSEYADSDSGKRSFKENFLKALKKVKMVYPTADIDVIDGGVRIRKSRPPIPKKLKITKVNDCE